MAASESFPLLKVEVWITDTTKEGVTTSTCSIVFMVMQCNKNCSIGNDSVLYRPPVYFYRAHDQPYTAIVNAEFYQSNGRVTDTTNGHLLKMG